MAFSITNQLLYLSWVMPASWITRKRAGNSMRKLNSPETDRRVFGFTKTGREMADLLLERSHQYIVSRWNLGMHRVGIEPTTQ
jgi:hypothetical protein